MKEGRDFSIVFHINEHFKEMQEEFKSLHSFEDFVNSKPLRKAILFDFFQIGELFKQLSDSFKNKFEYEFSNDLIGIRNRIAHGYGSIRDDIIYDSILNGLPDFIDKLNTFAKAFYSQNLMSLLGKKVIVTVDRKINSMHHDIIYELNYGYIEEMTALDGDSQDAYIINETELFDVFEGYVVAIIKRLDDVEDKLVVSKTKDDVNLKDIERQVSFQERFFKHIIIK